MGTKKRSRSRQSNTVKMGDLVLGCKKQRNRIEGGRRDERTDLLGVVEALHVVLAEEGAVRGLAAAAHALAEVHPEVVAPALVPVDAPPRRHRFLPPAADACSITLCPALAWLLVPLSVSLSAPVGYVPDPPLGANDNSGPPPKAGCVGPPNQPFGPDGDSGPSKQIRGP
jgi:hypothetical protein